MFSLLIPGRLPLTAPQQVDETHAVFPIDDAANLNHICIFMTGDAPLPQGYAVSLHLLPPGGSWKLLGGLSNTKPSAIYRCKSLSSASSASSSTAFGAANSTPATSALLGLSIESEQVVAAQVASLGGATAAASAVGPAATGGNDALALVPAGGAGAAAGAAQAEQIATAIAPKIAQNVFDYLSSYIPDSAPQTGPLLQKWLDGFQRKLKMQGIRMLERE
ncbi:hypothetical protein IE81DRAFT_312535 [Ceraceosorus guamensis]|uniref:Uncharacterized protein n=1 Tax=Ceraceosorus guamensis TaxID=1522189 RepID=A0A316W348_9BASI|nr:hypothetical protein IE81DRAFT_312535 [Ceraceosorus guamensis]PWN43193.1 hypothetical protein IE81DRAFT_312535 [Ceraceosorus guamensis]